MSLDFKHCLENEREMPGENGVVSCGCVLCSGELVTGEAARVERTSLSMLLLRAYCAPGILSFG